MEFGFIQKSLLTPCRETRPWTKYSFNLFSMYETGVGVEGSKNFIFINKLGLKGFE